MTELIGDTDEKSGSLSAFGAARSTTHSPAAPVNKLRSALEQAERQQILAALNEANWIVAGPEGAVTRLGSSDLRFSHACKKLGIRISRTGG